MCMFYSVKYFFITIGVLALLGGMSIEAEVDKHTVRRLAL